MNFCENLVLESACCPILDLSVYFIYIAIERNCVNDSDINEESLLAHTVN